MKKNVKCCDFVGGEENGIKNLCYSWPNIEDVCIQRLVTFFSGPILGWCKGGEVVKIKRPNLAIITFKKGQIIIKWEKGQIFEKY